MPLFGILNVNKPAGLTSRAAVDRVDRVIRPTRAGHAGTLDPLATGVLVICVGQATRLIQRVQQMPKTYHATFLLGRTSETDDTEGEVTELPNPPIPTRDELDRALGSFIGDIQQVPPAHSAVKLGGKRAYKLARRGVAVEIAPRTVTIHSIVVRRYEYPELEVDIVCGSGTYIRSLGRDLGVALGTAAVMSALERSAIGVFTIQSAITPEDLTLETIESNLQPALTVVPDLPRATLTEAQLLEIRNGRPILTSWISLAPAPSSKGQGEAASELAALDSTGRLVALLHERQPGELWPAMNFA
jgi:tRNA pseudouridine55 synthase